MPVKAADIGIISAALVLVIASFFYAYGGSHAQAAVFIKGEQGEWVYPLGSEETIQVSGPLGVSVIEIHDHTVRFLSSPCANQTCVARGVIDSPGQWAACLPNRVMLSISAGKPGAADGAVDAASW
ncbi:MAG: NusG domain II-containing protein [Treponema sp.]|nr:NusG domain II-containing protein [Treponema sp.]